MTTEWLDKGIRETNRPRDIKADSQKNILMLQADLRFKRAARLLGG